MQFPLKHLYWFGRHVFSGTKGKTKTSWHEQDAVPSEDRLYSSTPKGQQKGHADLSQWWKPPLNLEQQQELSMVLPSFTQVLFVMT